MKEIQVLLSVKKTLDTNKLIFYLSIIEIVLFSLPSSPISELINLHFVKMYLRAFKK